MISEGEKITKVDRTPVLQKSKQDVINLLKKKKNESETVIGLIKNPSPAIAFLDKVMIYQSYHYSLLAAQLSKSSSYSKSNRLLYLVVSGLGQSLLTNFF